MRAYLHMLGFCYLLWRRVLILPWCGDTFSAEVAAKDRPYSPEFHEEEPAVSGCSP